MTFHTPIYEGTAFETKAEGDLPNDDTTDVGAVAAAALESIRTGVAARLAALETKAADTTRLDRVEQRLSRPAVITTPAEAPGAIERKAFTNYLRRGTDRMPADEIKTLTVATSTAGGFLAPPEISSELLKRLVEFSPVRQYARVVSISAPEIRFPRRVNSAGATWVSETGARTGSEPSFEQIALTPYELATYVDVSTALLEDNAYDLETELGIEFAEAFGKTEGAAFVTGTGTGQPKGLFTAAGIAEFKTGAASSFPASNPADVLIGMFHALPTVHAQNGQWLMNRKTLGTIRQWKDASGRYLVIDPISESAATTLLGRPIVEAVDAPDIGAGLTPIMFGDLQGYRIVDRTNLETLRDPFSLAAVGQVRIHARKRVGADVTHPDRLLKLRVAV
jgi:HK97 family phage major capsid protein